MHSTLRLYPRLLDIKNAPIDCPCKSCGQLTDLSNIRWKPHECLDYKNIHNRTRTVRRHNLPQSSGSFDVLDSGSRRSYDTQAASSGNVPTYVTAGFVSIGLITGQHGFKECPVCTLSLCDDLLAVNPWREHARWYPFCPFVIKKKGENFVHEVVNETKKIIRDYQGLQDKMRNSVMDIDAVIEAMKRYPSADITETITRLFLINGEFPTQDELMYDLECRKLFKTAHQSIDYCRN